jgi:hypothetical protein
LSACATTDDEAGAEVGAVGPDDRGDADDLPALRELYPSLRRFAAVVGRADVDPDDLVQEAFTRLLVSRRREDVRDLGAYLRRTIVNLASGGADATVARTTTSARRPRSGAPR